jgi:hypothetical protein
VTHTYILRSSSNNDMSEGYLTPTPTSLRQRNSSEARSRPPSFSLPPRPLPALAARSSVHPQSYAPVNVADVITASGRRPPLTQEEKVRRRREKTSVLIVALLVISLTLVLASLSALLLTIPPRSMHPLSRHPLLPRRSLRLVCVELLRSMCRRKT